jgi:hypothetical protein
MSVHWLECLAPLSVSDPARLLEDAMAVHGYRVSERRRSRPVEPGVPGTLRCSQRRLPDGATYLHVSDLYQKLGRQWWDTLSFLSDGFACGYEQSEYLDIFDFRFLFSGCPLEARSISGWNPGDPDARTLWTERCALLLDAHVTFQETSELLWEEEWRVEPQTHASPAPTLRGGRAILADVTPNRFREIAGPDLAGWRYRPWTSVIGIEAIDLWRPEGLDHARVAEWAAETDRITVAWEFAAQGWHWHYWAGTEDHRHGITRDSVELIRELASGTTALGERPCALGGRGIAGWVD